MVAFKTECNAEACVGRVTQTQDIFGMYVVSFSITAKELGHDAMCCSVICLQPISTGATILNVPANGLRVFRGLLLARDMYRRR